MIDWRIPFRKFVAFGVAIGLIASLHWILVNGNPTMGLFVSISTLLLLLLIIWNEHHGTPLYHISPDD